MRKKYRNRTEIFAFILDSVASETGIGIANLMYACFLSYRQVTLYLDTLMKEDPLEYNEPDKVYRITTKGRQFLTLYGKMAENAGTYFLTLET